MRDKLDIAFWNLGRRQRFALLSQLVSERDIDILIVAEASDDPTTILSHLQNQDHSFVQSTTTSSRLHVYARGEELEMHEVRGHASGKISLQVMRFQELEFLLAATHLPSRLFFGREDQTIEAVVAAEWIRIEETHRGHHRTFVVGDFNMNPFDDGLVNAKGFHACTTRQIAMQRMRTVQSVEYPFFYNPMWRFFGDGTDGPPGTFFYRHSGHVSYDWNILDQVLVRPDALPWFSGEVQIVTMIGGVDLKHSNGRPNPDKGSDHFPITLRMTAAQPNEE